MPASALPGNHTVSAADPTGLGASATFLVQTDRASSRFDASGTGSNPYENVLSASNVSSLMQGAAPSWGGRLSRPQAAGSKGLVQLVVYSVSVATPGFWDYGEFALGCGTFGGIGGSRDLVGRGLDEPAAFATMDEAVGLGISVFDTAESYAGGASETMIGRWLAERSRAVVERVRLCTKVAPPYLDGADRPFDGAFLEERFSGSLERLGVDKVEFLLTHAPDDDTPIELTLEGLEAIRASGRCRYLGACNVDAAQLGIALDTAERLGLDGYRVVQNGFSLLSPQDDKAVRSMCAERGIAFTPFSPLAGGALTGKYQRGVSPPPDSRLALRPDGVDELLTPAAFDAIDRTRAVAQSRYGVECGALALAWLLHHREVTSVVTGPSRRSPHLELSAQALNIVLSEVDFHEIESWFVSAASSR